MKTEVIIKEIQEIVAEHIACNGIEINPNIDFLEEYSLDSIALMQVIFEIEDKYSIVFEEKDLDIEKINTIVSLADIVIEKKF